MEPNTVALLASVMLGEAGILGEEAMLAVGHVIMNRVSSNLFPDTVEDVIEQPYQWNGRAHPGAYHEALARKVLRRDHDPTGGMLYTLSENDRRKLKFPVGDRIYTWKIFKLHLYEEWPTFTQKTN